MRTFVLVSACVLALAAAGLAVGKSLDGTKSVKAVTGNFDATTASKVKTQTCTTSDSKTLVSSSGTYTGTATGPDPDFTGNATLQARSLINSTDNVGTVTGTLKIAPASGAATEAHFNAVYSGGQIAGLATGHAQDPHAKLLANISSAFSATKGFSGAKIGGGTAGGAAVELGPGRCQPSQAVKQTSEADGAITAVSGTSITVANVTCVVPAGLQSLVSSLTVGTHVEIRCTVSGGTATLIKVEKHH
jgi:hypothetical protein